jgi:integrase
VRLEPGSTKNAEGRMFSFVGYRPLDRLLRHQRERTDTIERATGQIIRWVFHREGAAIRNFRGAWRTACKRAGVPGRLFHDLRRTAVRNLERAGVPRSVAMKLTGHKTEAIYRRYAIVSEADLADAVLRLDRLHEEKRIGHSAHGGATVVVLGKAADTGARESTPP